MGKGSRLRKQREARNAEPRTTGPTPASAVPPAAPASTADAFNGATEFSAYLLHPYLHLAMDLDDLDMSPHTPAPQRYTPRPESLPWQVTRHAENIAGHMALVTPLMSGFLIEAMFAEAAGWLAESGYEPDVRAWFTGATEYLTLMVDAGHRQQAFQLLDYDRIERAQQDLQDHARLVDLQQAVTDEGPAGLPRQIVAFSLTAPAGTLWYAEAQGAEPAAAVHAACALLTWLFHAHGAVVNAPSKALAIAGRLHYLKR